MLCNCSFLKNHVALVVVGKLVGEIFDVALTSLLHAVGFSPQVSLGLTATPALVAHAQGASPLARSGVSLIDFTNLAATSNPAGFHVPRLAASVASPPKPAQGSLGFSPSKTMSSTW